LTAAAHAFRGVLGTKILICKPGDPEAKGLLEPRDHYVRLDSNDYSIHPAAVGRRIQIRADLAEVTAICDGRAVAQHPRSWAKHQTFTDPEHAAAATAMRRTRFTSAAAGSNQPAANHVVEVRDLAAYDTALPPTSLRRR